MAQQLACRGVVISVLNAPGACSHLLTSVPTFCSGSDGSTALSSAAVLLTASPGDPSTAGSSGPAAACKHSLVLSSQMPRLPSSLPSVSTWLFQNSSLPCLYLHTAHHFCTPCLDVTAICRSKAPVRNGLFHSRLIRTCCCLQAEHGAEFNTHLVHTVLNLHNVAFVITIGNNILHFPSAIMTVVATGLQKYSTIFRLGTVHRALLMHEPCPQTSVLC